MGICYDLNVPEIFRAAASAEVDFFLLAVGQSYPPHEIGRAAEMSEELRQLNMKVLPARAPPTTASTFSTPIKRE